MLTATDVDLEPLGLTGAGAWNFRTASHLLNRAGFGGSPDQVQQLVAMGPQRAVDHIVNYQQIPDDLAPLEFGTLSRPAWRNFREARQFFRQFSKKQRREYFQLMTAAGYAKMQEMRCWWVDRMVKTKRPLEEKMTLFWHGLFVSAYSSVHKSYHMYMQNQLFRRFAVGSVQALTLNISKDPAMLRYLNNNQNHRGHPNENYARELMELFTMGIGNYTEQDVRESARAWTGWAFIGEEFIFRRFQHDDGVKTFLGHTGRWDGGDIVRIIFEQPATARHFALKLAVFFGGDDPPDKVVSALAEKLRASNWVVAPVLAMLFSSRWFYSEAVMRRKIKSPVELAVGALGRLHPAIPNANALLYAMKSMGQELFEAPNVGGWPHGRGWVNTSSLFARYDLPPFLVTGRAPVGSGRSSLPHGRPELAEFTSGFSPGLMLAQAGISTTDEAVDFFLQRLIQDRIDPLKRAALVRVLNGTDAPLGQAMNPADSATHWRLVNVVELIMAMPEYQLC